MSHEAENKKETAAASEAEKTVTPETEPKAEGKHEEKHESKHEHHHEKAALEAKLEASEKKNEELKNQLLRTAAEYDNYRKRTTKEKENVYADAKADTVKEFLGVLDNLERGLAQFAEGDPHRQGMELICRQFLAVLEKLGVTRIEAQGQPFDPQKHDAVMHVEDENVGENTVVEVLQQGYQLGDKVLRFAMVKVAN